MGFPSWCQRGPAEKRMRRDQAEDDHHQKFVDDFQHVARKRVEPLRAINQDLCKQSWQHDHVNDAVISHRLKYHHECWSLQKTPVNAECYLPVAHQYVGICLHEERFMSEVVLAEGLEQFIVFKTSWKYLRQIETSVTGGSPVTIILFDSVRNPGPQTKRISLSGRG